MKPHVLVVEDDTSARLTLVLGLRGAGYRVTEAADGETALDLLEQDEFTIVLTDLILGEVSGIEVLYTARMQPYRPMVILLTGHGSLDTSLTAFRNGAYDYLLKPCAPDELLRCVAGAVKRYSLEHQLREAAQVIYGKVAGVLDTPQPEPTPAPPRAVTIGALSIGHSRRDITFHGQPIMLTPIEYTLLRYLAEAPGKTRSYREIVRQTHNIDVSDAEAQTLIRPHIHNLRTKIATDYLVTDRGVGYALIDPDAALLVC